MLNYLSNLFDSSDNGTRDRLLKDLRNAKKCFERAMRIHGINSNQANYWSHRADEAEKALGL